MCVTSRSRVIIADDHVLVAAALKQLLTNHFEVVATVHDGRSLIQAAQTFSPDVILVDISMPLLNGLDAAERIKRASPSTKIIYVTINHDPELVAESLRRGADGYLLKTAAASELVAAVKCTLAGGCYVSPALEAQTVQPQSSERTSDRFTDKLTERQIDVLQLLAEGRSMKEVASVLNLTTRTVAFHKYRLMNGLGLRNDAEIVQYAVRNHMLAA
ncbi:MAG TPA: response regulator transcription factor [Terriglobales bacterium]|jgi:DNA-binding NarL/FixJ family response regulator